jgi:uncharacterized protein (DUF433 family)
MATITDIGTLITQTRGFCGGRPRIAGSGISVRRVAGWYKMGRSPEEIVAEYGHLTLSQVYASIAYHHANREMIDGELSDEEAEYDLRAASHRFQEE